MGLARTAQPYRVTGRRVRVRRTEIAERLGISPRTVEVYKARMMEKLQCRTLAEVVRIGSEGRIPGTQ